MYGYASLVDGLVRKLKAELGFPCRVLATGGLAPLIVKHCEMVEGIDDHLTLEGLRILHERNAKTEAQRGRAAQ